MSLRPNTIANLEWISKDQSESFRWQVHDFPSALARWNYHPELEIHLIRDSNGKAFVGDYIGEFGPGYLAVVGPNIPHNWVSNLRQGQICRGRDVVLQFSQNILDGAAKFFPEIVQLADFLEATHRGLEFYGDTALRGGQIMEEIGEKSGYHRLLLFLDLLDLLASSHEFRRLTSINYVPCVDEHGTNIVQVVMGYILSNLSKTRMSEAAKLARMSTSTFSRFFKKNSGQNFIDFVHKVRISQACNLLANSSESITDICFACGYNNISNFNRHFLRSKHVIPSVYRRMSLDRFEGETPSNLKERPEMRVDRSTLKEQCM